jgi:hypothetical protein
MTEPCVLFVRKFEGSEPERMRFTATLFSLPTPIPEVRRGVDGERGPFLSCWIFEPRPTDRADTPHQSHASAARGSDPLAPRNILDEKIPPPKDGNGGSMTTLEVAEGVADDSAPSSSFWLFDCLPTHQAHNLRRSCSSSSLCSAPLGPRTVRAEKSPLPIELERAPTSNREVPRGAFVDQGASIAFVFFDNRPSHQAESLRRSCSSSTLGSDPLAPKIVRDEKSPLPIELELDPTPIPEVRRGVDGERGPYLSCWFFELWSTAQAGSRRRS